MSRGEGLPGRLVAQDADRPGHRRARRRGPASPRRPAATWSLAVRTASIAATGYLTGDLRTIIGARIAAIGTLVGTKEGAPRARLERFARSLTEEELSRSVRQQDV